MLAAVLVAGQAAALPPLLPVGDPACRYDRTAMLALDERAFDQDFTGGWRALSTKGCEASAADLIRDYRAAHPGGRLEFLSFWHEGQLRADVGQSAAAIALFDMARKPAEADRAFGWNLYVDGSIAFLRRDRAGLQKARNSLAVLPMPPGYGANARGPDGKPVMISWPMNLNVLDGFLRCFAKDYRIAYGTPTCSASMMRIKP